MGIIIQLHNVLPNADWEKRTNKMIRCHADQKRQKTRQARQGVRNPSRLRTLGAVRDTQVHQISGSSSMVAALPSDLRLRVPALPLSAAIVFRDAAIVRVVDATVPRSLAVPFQLVVLRHLVHTGSPSLGTGR